jgi:serine O-acetyltransferase
MSNLDKVIVRAIYARQRLHLVGLLALYGIDIPPEVTIGPGLRFRHASGGVVIHNRCSIGSNVSLYHRVTLARANVWEGHAGDWPGLRVEDEAIIGAGAVVLAGPAGTTIGRGSIVGANAVVTKSTGEWEIWAGNPARKVGERAH